MKATVRFFNRSTGKDTGVETLTVYNQDDAVIAAQEIADHEGADFTIESLEG